jgi:hypothetical protein
MRMIMLLTLALALPARAGAESGAVDWQRKVVKCTGSGAANLKSADGNPAVARIGAEKAAKLDAVRSCMETLKGVSIQSGQKVGDALAGDGALRGQVEGLVRGFRVVGKPRYFSDGGVEMDVEVPLEGALSDALLPRSEPAPAGAAPAPEQGARSASEPAGTSLVVDARGQKVAPALAPRILDESGKEIYGPALLAPEARKVGGAAAYARDLDAARKEAALAARIGAKPIVVKAVRAEGADLVISSADAAALSDRPGFLADGKVLILTD